MTRFDLDGLASPLQEGYSLEGVSWQNEEALLSRSPFLLDKRARAAVDNELERE